MTHPDTDLALETRTRGDTLVVRLRADRLDAARAIRFKDAFWDHTRHHRGRVLLDMDAVSFLDSSGLGALIAAMKAADPERRIELAGLTPHVMKVFALTRMDQVFTVHADVASGLGAGATA